MDVAEKHLGGSGYLEVLLEEVAKETKDREMPLASYLIAHGEAKLTAPQIQQVVEWTDGIRVRIPAPASP